VLEGRLSVKLPLAERVAVAFVVVGSDAGGKEVRFVVAAERHVAELSFSEQGDAGLPTGEITLIDLAAGSTGKRHRLDVRVDVVDDGPGAEDRFRREEAAGRERDPFDVN